MIDWIQRMKVAVLIMANLKSGWHVCISFPLYLDLEVCVTFVTAESVAKSPQFPEHFPPTSHFDFSFQEELSEAVFLFPGNKRDLYQMYVIYICHKKVTIHAWGE